MNEGLDFDDILILPRPSRVISRSDVDLSVNLVNLKLKIPVIAAPMRGIVSPDLIIELSRLGGIGILHRFYENYDGWLCDVYRISKSAKKFGVAVGLNSNYYRDAASLGANIICVDVANGYTENVLRYCNEVANYLSTRNNSEILLMAGNVATADGFSNLIDNGVDLVRVGIGSGTLCITRNMTGICCPQITAIKNCLITKQAYIVADGGIRNSGDAVKALAAGADIVMLGTLLAQTYESSHNGIIYGMASRKLQEEYYHSVKYVEGLEKEMVKTMALEDFIDEFTWGIKSACTYLDAHNLDDLRKNAVFIKIGTGSIKKL